jgi:hypothetical protein
MKRLLSLIAGLCIAVSQARAENSLADNVVEYAIRPIVTARSEGAAIAFIDAAGDDEKNAEVAKLLEHFGRNSKNVSHYLYTAADLNKDAEGRLLAFKLARLREQQAETCAGIKLPPDFGKVAGGFLGSSFIINNTESDRKKAQQMVDAEFRNRALNYMELNIAFSNALKSIGQAEAEISGLIDPARPGSSILNSESPKVRDGIATILEEQETRSRAAWKNAPDEQVYALMVGARSETGKWVFEAGEFRSLTVETAKFKGHCVLTELTLNLVGQSAGPRSMRVHAAFTVFKDGHMELFGVN